MLAVSLEERCGWKHTTTSSRKLSDLSRTPCQEFLFVFQSLIQSRLARSQSIILKHEFIILFRGRYEQTTINSEPRQRGPQDSSVFIIIPDSPTLPHFDAGRVYWCAFSVHTERHCRPGVLLH